MPLFIATVLISLLPAPADRPTPAPPSAVRLVFHLNDPAITTEGTKSSATIFCITVPEGGSAGVPIPVTITANGKDSELIIKQMIAKLAGKPVR